MNKLIPLLLLITILPSCAVAGGIFKAGVWVGIIIVVVVVAAILMLVNKNK